MVKSSTSCGSEQALRAPGAAARTSRRLLRRGASMVEYALLLFAVLIIAAAAFKAMGPKVRGGAEDAVKQLAP